MAPTARGSSAAFSVATNVRSIRCWRRCRRTIHLSGTGNEAGERMARHAAEHRRARVGHRARGPRQHPGAHVGADVRRGDPPATSRRCRPPQTGWLAGLRDPVVGQALAALHGEPATAWTVESLARAVGVSRSVLADRFAEMVGQPPMQYLALWRMQLASRLLLEGGRVAEVAAAVGYESEAAFSRAFKKLVGEAPATWRRSNKTA